MASQITADDSVSAETTAATQYYLTTQGVLTSILSAHPLASDIIFSPGRPRQAELLGRLALVDIPGLCTLTAEDTARIATDIMGENPHVRDKLRADGSCDFSYTLPGVSRFRVNIFSQRGSHAVVMRIIPNAIPTFETLKLPPSLPRLPTCLTALSS